MVCPHGPSDGRGRTPRRQRGNGRRLRNGMVARLQHFRSNLRSGHHGGDRRPGSRIWARQEVGSDRAVTSTLTPILPPTSEKTAGPHPSVRPSSLIQRLCSQRGSPNEHPSERHPTTRLLRCRTSGSVPTAAAIRNRPPPQPPPRSAGDAANTAQVSAARKQLSETVESVPATTAGALHVPKAFADGLLVPHPGSLRINRSVKRGTAGR